MTTRVTRRPPVAVVMLLLLLAACLLYSAQSAPHPAAGVTASVLEHEVHSPAVHDHQHGNEWSPPIGKRLRPQSSSGFAVVQVPAFPLVPAAATVPVIDPPPASISILRV